MGNPADTHLLRTGERLAPGQTLTSKNSKFIAKYEKNGNLYVFDQRHVKVIWSTDHVHENPSGLAMQSDGNLVCYSRDDSANPNKPY